MIRENLKQAILEVETIPSFHAIMGCDTVSFFAGHSKKTSWKTFTEHHMLLRNLGNGDLDDSTVRLRLLSYLILSYLILSYLILSYLILSYLILSYLILSYLILSYLILSEVRMYRVTDAENCNEVHATLFSICRSPEALPPMIDAAR